MSDQLLFVNMVLALAGAAALAIAPAGVTRLLGLPRAGDTFYPRMLAVTLIALVAAILAEGYGYEGLGPHGMAAINLVAGAALALLLLLGGLVMAKRGRWLLRFLALAMLALGAAQLAL
ncbi:MAG: hypothetical protein AAFQ42_10170 [Pseudomonadota bacterium]